MHLISRLAAGAPKSAAKRSRRPVLEGLEDRLLLYSTTGGLWTYGNRITYSFVPDGTNVGGTPSALVSTLNAKFSTATWKAAFQKAAAVWQAATNINFVEVSDNGAAIGSTGNQQGDANFGDIRIGGTPQSTSTLAFAFLPPPFNGGSSAGDIMMNTSINWQINSDYDLQTVAIHEFGHALGLGHSSTTTADMFASYNAIKQALTSDDVSGIQSIYGIRRPDAFDAVFGNNSSSTATNITSYVDANKQIAIAGLDITTSSDADWFKVTVPTGTTGTMTVSMQSTDLSSLSPRIQVYNSSLASLCLQSKPGTFGDTATATITGVTAGQTYYIKASNAGAGVTAVGSYGLLVNMGGSSQSPIAPPETTVAAQPDQGGGSANLTALGGVWDGLLSWASSRGFDVGRWIQYGNLNGWGDDLTVDQPGADPHDHAIADDHASNHADAGMPFLIGISADQFADSFAAADLSLFAKRRKS